MQKINFSIFIDASREKVWDTMLSKETYKKWTSVFNPTSTFKGDWSKGSKMIFTDKDENNEDGMVSRIVENIPYEYLSIEHLGIIQNGIEDTTSEQALKWAPAYENYTLNEKDGGTELLIEQDIDENEKETFEKMWPEALETIKKLSENK